VGGRRAAPAVTADLDDLVQALRRQPSIGGTIGFAGVGDDSSWRS